ncbi:MAG: hypothetical protein JSU00_18745 [Acidobacteria bacterium]|nr:hypothetical protein [Acidobacteriota bacterium]
MRFLMAALAFSALALAQTAEQDPVLRAMTDELARSRGLRVLDLDKPYYIGYAIEDADTFLATGVLGGLLGANRNRSRIPQVEVRTGDYSFDNTNHITSGMYNAARYDPERWPLDNNYAILQQCLWLATDRAYKGSLEALARKRASLKNAAAGDLLPDFYKIDVVKSIQPVKLPNYDEDAWTKAVVKLSGLFNSYPEIYTSSVSLQFFRGTSWFASSEGALQRNADTLFELRTRADAQAADGMLIHDATGFATLDLGALPPEAEARRAFSEVADNVRNLLKAPVGESYSGPVLFEGIAGAQLLAQLVGDNLRIPRRPISDPGRPIPFLPSDFETKLGSKILPEWMDVVDDATQKEYRGHPLAGSYPFDMEGVAPKPIVVVEKGVLKSFLTTRQPVKGANGSTGHARLQGGAGARAAAISNLFVKSSQGAPASKMKAQLIDLIKQRGKPYGLLVRKLDYPSSASVRELRGMLTGMSGAGGGSRPVSPPVLVYRVYPDGREQLVRGMRFRGLNARSLRDIVTASEETYAFDFVNNGAPFAMIGAGGYLAPATVVAPALLFDEVELEQAQDEASKPPIVPPPALDIAVR